MVRPPYVVLHKSEWNRLQKQGSLSPEPTSNDKKEHLKALTEQSQDWIKTWPDTVAGHIATLEKQKKKQHKDDIAFMKAYVQKLKQDNTADAIKKARQLIFQDSSYGRKLLSALLESRALDVREAQIKFRKKMQQKAEEIAKEEETKKGGINDFYDDEEREKLSKQKALECIQVNKEMVSLKKDKEMQTKLEEEKCAIEDEKFMKEVLEIEKKEKEEIKRREKEALEKYESDLKEVAKIKAVEKKLDDALTEVQKKKQDRIKCKTQEVLRKIHQGRPDTKWSKDHYEKIDRIQREEKKRYEDFITKGIERYEKRIAKKEMRDKIKEKEKQSSKYLLARQNKIAGDQQKLEKKCENKCACDRQSLTIKTLGKPAKKTGLKRDASPVTKVEIKSLQKSPKNPNNVKQDAEEKKPKLFITHRNKLIEDLKKREKVPTPWNGTKGLHVQFAQQADNVLKEIKHKHFARKVVDEYRKLNGLNAETLPIPNY